MRIEDATFVVTDTETTGSAAGYDRMIEIAAVKIRSGKVVDRFSQLVNPGCAVPRRITRLTGISTAMVFDKPASAAILPRFQKFLGNDILVAHNLSFDRRVINNELVRSGLAQMRNRQLCTLRLARRLLPGLRSRGLSSLIDFFEIVIQNRHRALDDAEATGTILLRLLARLDLDHQITTLEELLHFQNQNYGHTIPAHLKRIRSSLARRLPARPGVYFMRDGDGKVIYIGKAKNLRSRVRSYFNAVQGQPQRVRQMLEKVRDVTWEETGTELEALLAESRLIKELTPYFNRALKRYANRPFIKLDTASKYPVVRHVKFIVDDGAEYYGPVPGANYAEWLVDVINQTFRLRECDDPTLAMGRRCIYGSMGRCSMPCEHDVTSDYAEEVQRVRNFLQGRGTEIVLDSLEEEMRACADRMEYEEAGHYRDSIERLRRLLERQEAIAAPVLDHNAVLIMRDARGHAVKLFLVRFGRLVRTFVTSTPASAQDLKSVRFLIEHHFRPDQNRPERYMRSEIDEIRILADWMYAHRHDTETVNWSTELPLGDFAQKIVKRLAGRVEAIKLDDDQLELNYQNRLAS